MRHNSGAVCTTLARSVCRALLQLEPLKEEYLERRQIENEVALIDSLPHLKSFKCVHGRAAALLWLPLCGVHLCRCQAGRI